MTHHFLCMYLLFIYFDSANYYYCIRSLMRDQSLMNQSCTMTSMSMMSKASCRGSHSRGWMGCPCNRISQSNAALHGWPCCSFMTTHPPGRKATVPHCHPAHIASIASLVAATGSLFIRDSQGAGDRTTCCSAASAASGRVIGRPEVRCNFIEYHGAASAQQGPQAAADCLTQVNRRS